MPNSGGPIAATGSIAGTDASGAPVNINITDAAVDPLQEFSPGEFTFLASGAKTALTVTAPSGATGAFFNVTGTFNASSPVGTFGATNPTAGTTGCLTSEAGFNPSAGATEGFVAVGETGSTCTTTTPQSLTVTITSATLLAPPPEPPVYIIHGSVTASYEDTRCSIAGGAVECGSLMGAANLVLNF